MPQLCKTTSFGFMVATVSTAIQTTFLGKIVKLPDVVGQSVFVTLSNDNI